MIKLVPVPGVFLELQSSADAEAQHQNGWIRVASEVYPGSILYRPATARQDKK